MDVLVSVVRREPGVVVLDSRRFDVSHKWERFRAYKFVAWNLLLGNQVVMLPIKAHVTPPTKQ